MTNNDIILQRIDKTDAILLFTANYVYKIFTTNIVDRSVLNDLLRLDSLANEIPVFQKILPASETPFMKEGIDPNHDVLVMRRLNDENSLFNAVKSGIFKSTNLFDLATFVHRFHLKSPTISTQENYLLERLQTDLVLVKDKVTAVPVIQEFYSKTLELLEKQRGILLSRKVIEGHGDLNLEHLYLDGDSYCFIDFSHKRKYRVDDASRDVSGLSLHFVESGFTDLARGFLNNYSTISTDKNLPNIAILQMRKKLLLKYFIYSGGYAPEHTETKQLENITETIRNWDL